MTPIRLAGSVIGLIDGALAAFVAILGPLPTPLCLGGAPTLCTAAPPNPEFQTALLGAGVVLAVVSLVSFTGLRVTFALGAVLSATVLVSAGLTWGTYATNDVAAVLVLAAVALVADVVGSRPSRGLSEKDSPLNLPVFG